MHNQKLWQLFNLVSELLLFFSLAGLLACVLFVCFDFGNSLNMEPNLGLSENTFGITDICVCTGI